MVKRIFDVVVSCAALVVLAPSLRCAHIACAREGGPAGLCPTGARWAEWAPFYCLKFPLHAADR